MHVVLSISTAKIMVKYLSPQTNETQAWLTSLLMSLSTFSQCQHPLENFPSSRLKECKISLQKDLTNSSFISNLINSIYKYSLWQGFFFLESIPQMEEPCCFLIVALQRVRKSPFPPSSQWTGDFPQNLYENYLNAFPGKEKPTVTSGQSCYHGWI